MAFPYAVLFRCEIFNLNDEFSSPTLAKIIDVLIRYLTWGHHRGSLCFIKKYTASIPLSLDHHDLRVLLPYRCRHFEPFDCHCHIAKVAG